MITAPLPATTTTATTTTTKTSSGCATNGGTVAIAGITSPARLNIDQFQVSPATITYGTRSLTARFHVSACGGSVQGALVYVTAVPYGMFAVPNEQTTGADGWASLDFTALSGFPVSQKQLLVMFVRARKSGENILGGDLQPPPCLVQSDTRLTRQVTGRRLLSGPRRPFTISASSRRSHHNHKRAESQLWSARNRNGKHPVRFQYPAGPSTTTGLRPSRARRCSSPTEPRSRGRGFIRGTFGCFRYPWKSRQWS